MEIVLRISILKKKQCLKWDNIFYCQKRRNISMHWIISIWFHVQPLNIQCKSSLQKKNRFIFFLFWSRTRALNSNQSILFDRSIRKNWMNTNPPQLCALFMFAHHQHLSLTSIGVSLNERSRKTYIRLERTSALH